MIVTKKYCNRIGWRPLWVILAIMLVYCNWITPVGFAAEKEQAPAKPQDKTGIETTQEVLPTSLTVTLQDEDGAPIVGVNLSATAADFTGRVMDRATTDINGNAVFKHLKSGVYYFFANINAIHRHEGYGLQAMARKFKRSRSFYISESKRYDLSENAEETQTVKRNAFISIETYLQVVRSDKVAVLNKKMRIEQIVPLDSVDYLQIYLPMRQTYQFVTIKNDDFDAWILEIYAHERLRIELL